MSTLQDLLRQLRKDEKYAGLADELKREFDALADRRSFGLNFERHVPEAVELPGRKVRKGDKVRILPPRGEKASAGDDRIWRVTDIEKVDGVRIASLADPNTGTEERPLVTSEAPVDDLVVVSEFRDPIYPGLVSTGKVERGGDKPFHTVINAENFHALQALLFTHRGKVDCIYIDPPYNTGARDWKYDNDYVEGDDVYRHSKWLAMMERRLLLAKELLNPDDSVLIVTIDEKEVHRLGLLIGQIFQESRQQMATIVINPSGAGGEGFNRVEEYAIYVWVGNARPYGWSDNLLTNDEGPNARIRGGLSWESFLRSGRNWYRAERPNLCYPIKIDPETFQIVGVGTPFDGVDESLRPTSEGSLALAWPVRNDGQLGIWRKNGEGLLALVENGYAHVAARDDRRNTYSIKYLLSGTINLIANGAVKIVGRGTHGQVIADETVTIDKSAKTVWFRPAHNAGKHGSDLLGAFVPNGNFDFPKSLYAVEDAVRFAVRGKERGIVLDFFSGSGTTAHAVMRLNKQDGGRRQAILVTNNEVSADEQKDLRKEGLRPGDEEWEALGICDFITKPRIRAAITGLTPDGEPIKGDYKFTDEFPMADGFEENAEFFTLTYESPLRVRSNLEFARIAPLLWMRAGSCGRRIDALPNGWDVTDAYGVIADLDKASDFLATLAANAEATHAFIVTDEDRLFETLVAELPAGVEPVRLYDAYLRNFEIESGRLAR